MCLLVDLVVNAVDYCNKMHCCRAVFAYCIQHNHMFTRYSR